jgi:RHS repeat-associated protein
VTGSSGTTTSTYGYTAYGQPIASQFTGADKNNASPGPATEPFSSYRFNAMRWDSSSGQYDMGFRNYSPGLNQFLSRDMYNGALADMGLSTDPFTGNRYTFGAGNPVSNIELDGHMFPAMGGGSSNSGTTPAAATGGCSGFWAAPCTTPATSRPARPTAHGTPSPSPSGGWCRRWPATCPQDSAAPADRTPAPPRSSAAVWPGLESPA